MRKLLVGIGLMTVTTLGLSAGAWAAPNPNPHAPHETPCVNVLSHNPNTGPGGISPVGGEKFGNALGFRTGLDPRRVTRMFPRLSLRTWTSPTTNATSPADRRPFWRALLKGEAR